jgi:hypothetical protein
MHVTATVTALTVAMSIIALTVRSRDQDVTMVDAIFLVKNAMVSTTAEITRTKSTAQLAVIGSSGAIWVSVCSTVLGVMECGIVRMEAMSHWTVQKCAAHFSLPATMAAVLTTLLSVTTSMTVVTFPMKSTAIVQGVTTSVTCV